MPGPGEAIGIGTDTAQLMGGGMFAAGAREYLRPSPGGWRRRLSGSMLVLMGAYLFGPFTARLVHGISSADIPLTVAGSIAGLACLGVAEGILSAAGRIDLTLWSPFSRAAAPAAIVPPPPPLPVHDQEQPLP